MVKKPATRPVDARTPQAIPEAGGLDVRGTTGTPGASTGILAFTVIGTPQPQGSSRAFKRGSRVIVTSDNPQLRGWRELVAYHAAQAVTAQGWTLTDGPVAVAIGVRLVRPASVSVRRRPEPTTRPDLDKLIRSTLDALTGVIYRDDSQVVVIGAQKTYAAAQPGLTVTVEAV